MASLEISGRPGTGHVKLRVIPRRDLTPHPEVASVGENQKKH